MQSHGQHHPGNLVKEGIFTSVHMGLRFVQQQIPSLCGVQRITMVQACHIALP